MSLRLGFNNLDWLDIFIFFPLQIDTLIPLMDCKTILFLTWNRCPFLQFDNFAIMQSSQMTWNFVSLLSCGLMGGGSLRCRPKVMAVQLFHETAVQQISAGSKYDTSTITTTCSLYHLMQLKWIILTTRHIMDILAILGRQVCKKRWDHFFNLRPYGANLWPRIQNGQNAFPQVQWW